MQKPFDELPPFQPIIDTTGTAHQPVAKYLSRLLNPLTLNDFSLQDSFDAITRIENIPQNLFAEGYRFVSFEQYNLNGGLFQRLTITELDFLNLPITDMGFDPADRGSVFLTSIKASTPINNGVECLGRWSGLDLSACVPL